MCVHILLYVNVLPTFCVLDLMPDSPRTTFKLARIDVIIATL